MFALFVSMLLAFLFVEVEFLKTHMPRVIYVSLLSMLKALFVINKIFFDSDVLGGLFLVQTLKSFNNLTKFPIKLIHKTSRKSKHNPMKHSKDIYYKWTVYLAFVSEILNRIEGNRSCGKTLSLLL